MRSSRAPDHREGQHRSAFTDILELLVDASVGRVAAVLVDREGEAVDHAGKLPAYEAKLAGAHWQIVLREAGEAFRRRAGAGVAVGSLAVCADKLGFFVHGLEEGYVLVLVCTQAGAMAVSPRALREVEVELSREAGWPLREPEAPRWFGVLVTCDRGARPATVHGPDGEREQVASLEPLAAAGDFERAFRIRTAQGRVLELVREASGHWYAWVVS